MNSDQPISLSTAARTLAMRRKHGEQGALLPPNCRPITIDAALAIQAAVAEEMGDRIGGWKCGMPVDDRVILAPIHAQTIHAASPCPAWARDNNIRVEPELAFILGSDLPARGTPYTSAEIDAAIARTHLALELIDSRYNCPEQASFVDHLADGLLNQGLFLGPQVDGEQARSADAFMITVDNASDNVINLEGRHPNEDPRAPLYWLANTLCRSGQGLQAGQAVITGSYAGSIDLPLDRVVHIRYGELGILTVCFAPR